MRPRTITTTVLMILATHAAWAGMPVVKENEMPHRREEIQV